MKHSLKITLLLTSIFFFSQIIGLVIVNKYIDYAKTTPEQIKIGNITWQQLPYSIERPEVSQSNSYLLIFIAILLGTGLLLILIKYKIYKLWKFWYFLSVMLCMSIALSAFIKQSYAFLISLALSLFKIFKPNVYLHNLTELFVYGGLAAIFVPIMNLYSVILVLLLISVYDVWAVFKSKHMAIMANFQTETNLFAGLLIPYSNNKLTKFHNKALKTQKPSIIKINTLGKKNSVIVPKQASTVKNAVLGGGDIGFPLMFAGVVMKSFGLYKTLLLPVFVTIGLLFLLLYSKEDKFYPAMPVLTLASFIGYGIILLI